MKARHAAALALVGWYLMTPPLLETQVGVGLDEPLSRWDIQRAFDTAAECEAARSLWIHENGLKSTKKAIRRGSPEMGGLWVSGSKCIATDDPRLKGN